MLPYNDYFEYYGPDYRLHMPTSNMENMNKRETLEEVRFPVASLSEQPKFRCSALVLGLLKVGEDFLCRAEGFRTCNGVCTSAGLSTKSALNAISGPSGSYPAVVFCSASAILVHLRLPNAFMHKRSLNVLVPRCFFVAQTKIQLFEILRSLEAVPGVPIETGAEVKTPATLRMPEEDEDMPDVDVRQTGTCGIQHLEKRVDLLFFVRVGGLGDRMLW